MSKLLSFLVWIILANCLMGCCTDSNENENIENPDYLNEIEKGDTIDRSSPFLGKWTLVSIEDGETILPYTGDNATVCFKESGGYAYTPYVTKDIEGKVTGTYESSESIMNMKYSFTEKELFIHLVDGGIKYVHNYSFSEDNKILRIVLTKAELEGDVCYILPPSPGPMLGKMQMFKKITK